MKVCSNCEQEKTTDDFYKNKSVPSGLTCWCKECDKAKAALWNKNNRERRSVTEKRWRNEHPFYSMWQNAKQRSKERNTPFNIKLSDIIIPKFCPVLGIKLELGNNVAQYNSPSLDCIIPEKGYTLGNIAVISHKANTIKSGATSTEIRKVSDWLYKYEQN